MIAYPSTLPPPVRDNFSVNYTNKISMFKMDDGGRRALRSWEDQPRTFNLVFVFTWKQLGIFEGWYHYELKDGALYGQIPIQGGTPVEVLFTENPKITYNKSRGHWEVSVRCISIQEGPTIPVSDGDYPIWPSSLPLIEKEGYEYVREGAIHPNVPSGYQDGRQRFKTRRAEVNFSLILSPEQKTAFETFVKDVLIGATAPFKITLVGGGKEKVCVASFSEEGPTIQPLGAYFTASGTLTTFELPELSELEYRFGNEFSISEIMHLDEQIATEAARFLQIGEKLTLSEHFYRTMEFADSFTLTENVVKRFGLNLSTEILNLVESIVNQGQGNYRENVNFIESVQFQVHKKVSEILGLNEVVLTTKNYNRLITEVTLLAESLLTEATYSRDDIAADTATFGEQGSVSMQDYAAQDYFAQDYTGTWRFF